MSMKKLFADQLRLQREVIAKETLKQAFATGQASRARMGDLMQELKEDDSLWSAFEGLRLGELRDMLCPSSMDSSLPGPSRKRGVTSLRIIDFVAANPGTRRGEIMGSLGLKGGTVSSQLRMLRTQGRLRGEGEERNLQYFPG